MAGVADKARFYLEQAVPQLREFEDKEIFTKDEIRNLVRKRSDFEHRVLAPGSRAPDYEAYIAWEAGLETLRARRCARLRIRQLAHGHAGAARITALHERGVARDPGSVALWRSYLSHLTKTGASKRWRRVATRALRLHPQEASLWTLAGRRAAANGDMDGARAYFMRGCRFCGRGPGLWVEYARVEMEWLARMEARGKAGGRAALAAAKAEQTVEEGDHIAFGDDSDDDGDGDEEDGVFGTAGGEDDNSLIPDPTRALIAATEGAAQKPKPSSAQERDAAARKLEKSPALNGAIPRAIFDVARKQAFFDADAAQRFFDLFARFPKLEAQPALVQHVLDAMAESYPRDAATWDCRVRQPLIGVEATGAGFPAALREALARLREGLEVTDKKADLAARTVTWIAPILAMEDLDEAIRTVLEHTKRKMEAT